MGFEKIPLKGESVNQEKRSFLSPILENTPKKWGSNTIINII